MSAPNETNLWDEAPFRVNGGVLRARRAWFFDDIDNDFRASLREAFSVEFCDELPPVSRFEEVAPVYFANFRRFQAQHWAHVLPTHFLVQMTPQDKERPERLLGLLGAACTALGVPVFAKLGECSTKKNHPPAPCCSPQEIVDHLFSSARVRAALKDNDFVLVVPWEDGICPANEFRVFVRDRRVVAVCRQAPQSQAYLPAALAPQILAACKALWATIGPSLAYKDLVLDVWLRDYEEARLIEVNPFGSWTGAGSGQFTWREILEADRPLVRIA